MKAVIIDEKGQLTLRDVKIPIPKEGEILVQIMASGFNPIDYQMLENELERKLLHSPILGREFSGIVVEIGNAVKKFKIGDAVFSSSGSMGSNGTYAEYISIPEKIAVRKPNTISFFEAAGIPSAGLTALQCFNRMKASKKDSIFIAGAAGGVGSMLVKLLRANGHRHFIATAGNPKSIALLKEIGMDATQIVAYQKQPFLRESIALNQGKKFDIVVDLVGNKMAEQSASLLKTNGIYLDVTALSTPFSREILFNIGATILNISNYAYSLDQNFNYYKKGLLQLSQQLENLEITPPNIKIVGDLSVETVREAHNLLRENKTNGKKLILQINTI